jgi:hypothetical protein
VARSVEMKQLDELATAARRLLPSMLDDQKGLFAHKAVRTSSGVKPLGSNAVYSAMSVVGILSDGGDWPADALPVDRILERLHELALHSSPPGNLVPTTIWALAESGDERACSLVRGRGQGFSGAGRSSMELGLLLAALAATMAAFPDSRDDCVETAALATAELLDRFSDSAQLFRGRAKRFRPSRQFDWLLTSFASQVYPIHGLARFALASETDLPGEAVRAADHLVEHQGPLGQWWWIYSTASGAVLDGYPVYSVHQDAMAFMALAPLQILGIRSYDEELAHGLRWMFGENELSAAMVDVDHPFFSRCIERRGANADGSLGMSGSQRLRVVLSSWGLPARPDPAPRPEHLEVLAETRPYHLGWVLYARSLMEHRSAAQDASGADGPRQVEQPEPRTAEG